jgi:mono/diheme cytochrome c family protein
MANIRAAFTLRIWFLVTGVCLLAAMLYVFRAEERRVWKKVQREYREAYIRKLVEKRQQAVSVQDEAGQEKWSHLLEEAKNGGGYRIEQVFLPRAGVRDLCQTCHQAMENPLFRLNANPLRQHPAESLRHHKPNRFGCTFCHGGQGVGLTVEKAHGEEDNWPVPRVPHDYVQGLCLGCHETPFQLAGAEKAEQGRRIFMENGCFGCHQTRTMENLPPASSPFEGVGVKIENAAWVHQWIKEPQGMRPRTRMPTFRLKEEEIRHIVSYLSAKKEIERPLTAGPPAGASAGRGKDLFSEKGCIGCHSVERGDPTGSRLVPNLADAGFKLSFAWISAWLESPLALSDQTPMPTLVLTSPERWDIALYLKSLKPEETAQLLEQAAVQGTGEGDPEQGKRLVQLLGCYGCHPVREMEQLPLPAVEVAEVAKKRLEELPFGNSKVPQTKWDWLSNKIRKPAVFETRDMPLKMPDYELSDADVGCLTVFYLQNRYYDLPEDYLSRASTERRIAASGEWMLERYHCGACHLLREGIQPRIERFLALKSLAPPRLVGEAERVQPQWFFQYLSRPVQLRPWLRLRMPTFNWKYEDRQDLIAHFSQLVSPEAREAATVPYVVLPVRQDYSSEIVAMGEYRVRTDKCVQCHPISLDGGLPQGIKVEDLSINLMLSKSRLRFEWLKNFLRNPDRYAGAGTKMPFVYYTPDGVPRIPEPEKWIEYSALFLMFMDKVPEMPREQAIEEIRPGADVDWTQY